MFSSQDTGELTALLDLFQVPMFAAEQGDDGNFYLLHLNKAHTERSGLHSAEVRQKAVSDILPPDEASEVNARYATCCETEAPLSYRESLTIQGRRFGWNTSLIPVITPQGVTRVIGSAVVEQEENGAGQSRLALDDINYFSIQAQFQLSRVTAFLDSVTEADSNGLRPGDLKVLAGLCRSVDQCLSDIRQQSDARRPPTASFLMCDAALPQHPDPSPRHQTALHHSLRELSTLLGRMH